MGSRLTIACLSVVVLLGVQAPARSQQNPYRLKEADQKKLCLACHDRVRPEAEEAVRPHPGADGRMFGMPRPPRLVAQQAAVRRRARICAGCHDSVVPAKAKSTHQVVADGECQKCHDPHASDNPANLLAKGNELVHRLPQGDRSRRSRSREVQASPGGAGVPDLPRPAWLRPVGPAPEDRGACAVREVPQARQPGLRGAAHEIPGSQGRPARPVTTRTARISRRCC